MEDLKLLNIKDWGSIDLIDFDLFGDGFQEVLLEKLIDKVSFQIGVFVEETEEAPVWLAAFEDENARWQVGYPILDWKYGKDHLVAPLFLWDIEIDTLEPQKRWLLRYDANRSARLNIDLKDYLKDHISFEEEFGLFPNPNQDTLEQMGIAFEKVLKIEHDFLSDQEDEHILELKSSNTEKQSLSHAGCLLAQANLLHPYNQAKNIVVADALEVVEEDKKEVHDVEQIESASLDTEEEAKTTENKDAETPKDEKKQDVLGVGQQWKTQFVWNTAISNAQVYKASQICWSGKHSYHYNINKDQASDWLAALLPNMLSDQSPTLIITEDESWQYDVRIKLEKITGWRDIGFWTGGIGETHWQQNLEEYFKQLPRLLAEEPNSTTHYETYRKSWYHYLADTKVLNANIEQIQTKVLEKAAWTDTVAAYLNHQQKGQREWVDILLKNIDFSFNEAEYEATIDMIHLQEPLYKSVLTLEHPLLQIQDKVIEGQTLEQADRKVQEYLLKVQGELLHIQRQYMDFIADYADDIRRGFEDYAEQLRSVSNQLIRNISLYDDVYGEAFSRSGTLSKAKLSLFKVFSKRSRQVADVREKIFETYDALAEAYAERNMFEAKLPNLRKLSNLLDAIPKLEAFVKEVDAWEGRIEKWVEQKLKELTTQLPIKLDFRRKLKAIEEQFNKCLVYIREQAVVQQYWELREINVNQQLQKLASILTYYRNLSVHYRDFEAYFRWRQHWLIMSAKDRAVIQALVQIEPTHWDATFASWYLHAWLLRLIPNGLNIPTMNWEDYQTNIDTLKPAILDYSLMGHRARQDTLFQQESWVKEGRSIEISLVDFLAKAKDRGFNEVFPFVVATAEQAETYLLANNFKFNTAVVFDSESTLSSHVSSLADQWIVLSSQERRYLAQDTLLDLLDKQPLFKAIDWSSTETEKQFSDKFQLQVKDYLAKYISPDRIQTNVLINGVEVDIVITPIHGDAAPIAISCEGGLNPSCLSDYSLVAEQDKIVRDEGYVTQQVWSLDWLKNTEQAVQKLVAFIVHWDNQYLPTQ